MGGGIQPPIKVFRVRPQSDALAQQQLCRFFKGASVYFNDSHQKNQEYLCKDIIEVSVQPFSR